MTSLGEAFAALGVLQVMGVGIVFFALLYGVTGLVTWTLTQVVMPRLRYGRRIDTRALEPGQLRREIGASAVSILIFGAGLVFPWGLLQLGWATLTPDPAWLRVAIEVVVLFVWNEAHFYANHRLLHTSRLRRFHAPHHRSHVATPFSTYSFHPVEAILLGSVPLIPMMLHDFSFAALLSLPLMSIVLNNLGHANYEFSREAPARGWRGASRRHHLHHACYHGNYGFLIGTFDRMFGTALPLDAADARLARAGRRDA
ncbi:sterol desaturase family protein [Dokdonella sp. MW10]|uniref:sterol desaturase family protein n=1 Tax=Dokdonella sp. MW10 TaxID=2992926 RepID=UPI003F7E239A